MISLDKFKVKRIKESDDHGVFEIGPLPRGYGYTIGNSVRRILLSAIPGAAVTAVEIEGVKHEYSSMDGVQDDIIAILLKLKELAVRLYSEDPQKVKLHVKGKKGEILVVKAGDFELPSDVEIVNPELEITTLTKDIDFKMTLTIEQGIGYAYSDENRRKEIGVLPLDSIFSPVKRVQVEIVNTRFGQDTDLDQINIEVFTNTTVTPTEAMLKSAEIYDQIANKLVDLFGGDSSLNEIPLEEKKEEIVEEEKILVSQLNLSTRLTNSLLNSGISDLKELKNHTREECTSFRGMGKKSMTELEDIMLEKVISFASEK
ncbi:MAG: DNA-directed RNA polymerase subunit alpha [bacterium]